MQIISVWVEHPLAMDKPLYYRCTFDVQPGMRVAVPLNNRQVVGIVHQVSIDLDRQLNIELKDVLEVFDKSPVCNDEMLSCIDWLGKETICEPIHCYNTVLPPLLKAKSNQSSIKKIKWAVYVSDQAQVTVKQSEVLAMMKTIQSIPYQEYRNRFKAVGKKLIDLGCVKLIEKEVAYAHQSFAKSYPQMKLTEHQQKVYDQIELNTNKVYLLFGSTGSGKTEIYMQLAAKILESGQDVLVLVPEISLTPQMIERFQKRFGMDVIVYHSSLSLQQRTMQFQRVRNKQGKIAIGTRSAVFLPFENLGCIILDEEHDSSFKQESKQPFYHARDVAIFRGKYHQCPIILGSATPSLESYARALKKVYHLLPLVQKHAANQVQCTLVDTRLAMRQKQSGVFTPTLIEAIADRLDRNQQVILLLNRRGYHPILTCQQCHTVAHCPHCDVAMAYHQVTSSINCHLCGFTSVKLVCSQCKSTRFKGTGMATQKLEEELMQRFPMARVLRMDADSTSKKQSHHTILSKFAHHEADILIGTQMIAKGLDIEKVTLVGIINADAAIGRADYRSVENAFSLIMQAAGRSGRGQYAGEVIIQAFDVSHYAVVLAAKQDYISFFKQEMKYRHVGQYPPYQYLVAITIADTSQEKAYEWADKIAQKCREGPIRVLGPADLGRAATKFRYRIVCKSKDLAQMRSFIAEHIVPIKRKAYKTVISINVSPLGLH